MQRGGDVGKAYRRTRSECRPGREIEVLNPCSTRSCGYATTVSSSLDPACIACPRRPDWVRDPVSGAARPRSRLSRELTLPHPDWRGGPRIGEPSDQSGPTRMVAPVVYLRSRFPGRYQPRGRRTSQALSRPHPISSIVAGDGIWAGGTGVSAMLFRSVFSTVPEKEPSPPF